MPTNPTDDVRGIAFGMSDRLAQILHEERQRQRDLEDQDLQYRQQLLTSLINRPDFNPAMIGRAFHDILDLQNAKSAVRKPKKGMAGMFGATELPMSQLLSGLSDGMTQIMGRTTEPVPPPVQAQNDMARMTGVGSAQMTPLPIKGMNGELIPQPPQVQQPQAAAPAGRGQGPVFDGKSVLDSPVSVPPESVPTPPDSARLMDAAHQLQDYAALGPNPQRPVQNQPLLRSPEEMNQLTAASEAAKSAGQAEGKNEAMIKLINDPRLMGDSTGNAVFSDQEKHDILRKAIGLPAKRVFARRETRFRMPDGSVIGLQLDPASGQYYNMSNPTQPEMAPAGGIPIGMGPLVRYSATTDDFGNVHLMVEDPNAPGGNATAIATPQGIKGRTSPEGPVFTGVDSDTGKPYTGRLPRRGTGATQITVGGGAGGGGYAPAPSGVPQVPPPPQPGAAPQQLAPETQGPYSINDAISQAMPHIAPVAPQGPAAKAGPGASGGPNVPNVVRNPQPPNAQPNNGAPTEAVTLKGPDGSVRTFAPGQLTIDQINKLVANGAKLVPNPAGTGSSYVPPANGSPLVKLNADESKLSDTVRQAAPMVQSIVKLLNQLPNGGKSNGLFDQIKQVGHAGVQRGEYALHMKPTDEVYSQLIPLVELMKVFQSQQYLHGIRNMDYVNQIQSHLLSSLDSPDQMRAKLKNLIPAMHSFMESLGLKYPQQYEVNPDYIPEPPRVSR